MGGKKATFTCKVCLGEHAGLICTKYSSVRVVEKPIDRVSRQKPALLAAPIAPLPELVGEATDVTISPHVTKSPARTGRPKTGARTAAQRKADSRAKKAAKA